MSKNPKSRTHQLRDTLEDEIVNGRLQPGDRLDEASLAARFKVSRTPIREALQQLAAAGLVQSESKRGTFVARIGIPQLVEMFEVMAELEGMCGRLAARRISETECRELKAAMQACRDAANEGDTDAYYYENERFHYTIYHASHNQFLIQSAHQLHQRLKPYRRLQLRVRNRVPTSVEEHARIVDAILAGDPMQAEASLKNHILIQGERFTDFIASVAQAAAESEKRQARTA
jgi:DNA-binding GntR family transcriptional regulator